VHETGAAAAARAGLLALAGLLVLAGSLVAAAPAWAADRNGVIVDVDGRAEAFTVRTTDAARAALETFRVDRRTRITFENKEVPFGNLVPGGHVTVHYKDDDRGALATAVTIHRLRHP